MTPQNTLRTAPVHLSWRSKLRILVLCTSNSGCHHLRLVRKARDFQARTSFSSGEFNVYTSCCLMCSSPKNTRSGTSRLILWIFSSRGYPKLTRKPAFRCGVVDGPVGSNLDQALVLLFPENSQKSPNCYGHSLEGFLEKSRARASTFTSPQHQKADSRGDIPNFKALSCMCIRKMHQKLLQKQKKPL